jgi:hypothetical protein
MDDELCCVCERPIQRHEKVEYCGWCKHPFHFNQQRMCGWFVLRRTKENDTFLCLHCWFGDD